MKKILTAALAGLALAAGIGATEAAQAQPGYYHRGYDSGRHYGGGYYGGGRNYNRGYYRDRGDGALAALAAGALIGSAVASNRGYDRYYDGGYDYYDRPYRVRCYSQRVWDPYWGRSVVRRVCR
jgi:hypothetical protein